MPTRAQAKIAMDAANTAAKAAIDKLPSTVNIQRGHIVVNPQGWTIIMKVNTVAEAEALRDAIIAVLTLDGKSYDIETLRRSVDGEKQILITASTEIYRIVGY